ncbi:unnamed protein product [Durusdinium trenchii]|uniref:Uncharacterized protein n=1 Tax=Durusdinium trenchii TaxID=1381693 RepID=A0ABP0JXX2_9DINO
MALQDYQRLPHFVTENLLREVGRHGGLTSVQRANALCVWSMSLGLRRPTEPTPPDFGCAQPPYRGRTGSEDGSSANGQDLFDLFRCFKGHFKKMQAISTSVPLDYISVLPTSAEEFASEYPSTWKDFSSARGNAVVAMDERWHLQLSALKMRIPMRRTHSMVDTGSKRAPSAAASPRSAAANQVLQQFFVLVGNGNPNTPQRGDRQGMGRRFWEKSPGPRAKLNQATALLERLQAQVGGGADAAKPQTSAPQSFPKTESNLQAMRKTARPRIRQRSQLPSTALPAVAKCAVVPFLAHAEESPVHLDDAMGF